MNFIDFSGKFGNSGEKKRPFVSAVIVAAGSSTRMGTGKSKQFLPLCGIAAIARTLSAFEQSRFTDEVVIVTNKFDFLRMAGIVKEFGYGKVKGIVIGGKTRQQSAILGFRAISGRSEFVAVHDGARPLVSPEKIDKVIESAFSSGASALAVRVKDTIKITGEDGLVVSTPNRYNMWAVQTPQVFKAELYRKAAESAEKTGADYTDDCQLIETVGGQVKVVEGSYDNIKITTGEDVAAAEALLRLRGDAF